MLELTRRIGLLVMVVVLAVPGAAAATEDLPPGGTFVDDDGDVHEGYIEAIAAAGVTRGCDPPLNIHYCPGRAVTRGEMAAFLVRSLDLPSSSEDAFVDDAGSIFEPDIDALAAAGITKGCNPPDNDHFCAGDPLKRSQMASLLGRALQLTPFTPSPRPELVPGMEWSVELTGGDAEDKSLGWTVAFADAGVVAAGGSTVVFFTPMAGWWLPTVLEPTSPDFEEISPLGLAASGDRVVVTAYGLTPVVYVFQRDGAGWVDERIPLPYEGGFEGTVAIDGDRIVARWGSLQFVELNWTGTEWLHELRELDVVGAGGVPGPIDLDGDILAFGDPWADTAYAARRDGATWSVTRLAHPWDGEVFGSSVDVDGDRILVGASGASPGPGGPGGVYLYTWNGSTWVGQVVAEGSAGFGDEARISGDTVITTGASGGTPSFWVFSPAGETWDGYEVILESAPLLARLALRGSLAMASVPPTAFAPNAVYLFELP